MSIVKNSQYSYNCQYDYVQFKQKSVNRETAERNCANWEKYVWVRKQIGKISEWGSEIKRIPRNGYKRINSFRKGR